MARARHTVQERRNLDTGEIERLAISEEINEHRARYAYDGKEWFSMAKSALTILRESRAHASTWAVYAYVIEHVKPDNTFCDSQTTVAEHTGLTRERVNAALKQLNQMRLIVPMTKRGTLIEWALNPRFAFKGSAKAQNAAVNAQRPAKPRLVHDASKLA